MPRGDWTGQARAANGTQGNFAGFAVQNSSNYAFVVGTSTFSEYCLLAPNSASAGNGVVVYTGTRFSQQGSGNTVNDNTACRVTLSNGTTVAQPPVQPPIQPPTLPGQTQAQLPALSFPPRLEVGQRWEFRLGNRPIVYRTAFTGQENRSGTVVYTGTLVTDGQGDPVASRKLEAFMSGDTFAVYATDPQGGVTVCSFAGANSLQNNVLTGAVFFRTAGQSQFSALTTPDSAPCRANLEPIQGATQQPTNPIQPPPIQTLNATLPVLVGDTWQVSAAGFQPWTLVFNKLEDGDPSGTSTQGNTRGEALALRLEGGATAFLMETSSRIIVCTIPANSRASGASFSGALSELVPQGNQSQLNDLKTACTATLTARGTGTGTGTTAITPPPTQNLSASFPPKVGQTWTLTIDGLAPWSLVFDKSNQDGISGRATQNGVPNNTFAFVDSGENWFQVFGNNLVYFCVFPARPQINGASLVGGQAFSAPDPNAQLTRLNRGCTATLNSQTLLMLYKAEHTRQKMPIKLSPLF